MATLFFYLFLALFVSFICSLTESVLLSAPKTYLTTIADKGNWAKSLLKYPELLIMDETTSGIQIEKERKIIENTSMKSLLKKLDKETFVFDLAQEISVCPKIKGYSITLSDQNQLEVEIPKSESLNGLFAEFSKQKLSIVSMRIKTNRLEELFIGMVEKNLQSEKIRDE